MSTTTRITVHSSSGLAQEIETAGHGWIADEPIDLGGTDRGPTPYEMLLGALGACTAMTLRMYADRKGWPLQQITVELSHEKTHARDCADCPDKDAKLDRIARAIQVGGPLDAEQRARLLEIANKCPVHRTLTGTIRIDTRLVE